jgi:hypothetical protein
MLESHSEPAPPQVAQPRQEITQLGANPVLAAGAVIKNQDLTTLWFERRHFYLVLSVNAIGQLKMTRDNSRNGDVFVKGFPPQCVAIESQSHFL